MCGFVGAYSSKILKITLDDLHTKAQSMKARGPDFTGAYESEKFLCLHHRLSIIDVTDKSHQPLISEDQSVILCFNGEIYNYKSLRESLKCEFTSEGDGEVILRGYQEEGKKFFSKLRGIFAFSLFDKSRETLYLVRDPYGVKPLFYKYEGDTIHFSSVIRPLLSQKQLINNQAIWDYFSLGYIPQNETAFYGIEELAPNTVREINSGLTHDYQLTSELDLEISKKRKKDYDECFLKVLKEETQADVPYGLMLSSGLDSSTLLYYLKRMGVKNLKTYSLVFDENSFDESEDIKTFQEIYDIDAHFIKVTPNKITNCFDSYINSIEQPYADGSAIPTYLLAQKARDDVKVLLSGEGGDEIFGGYITYQAYLFSQFYKRVPVFIQNYFKRWAQKLPTSFSKLNLFYKIKTFTERFSNDDLLNHMNWRLIFSEEEKKALFHVELEPTIRIYEELKKEVRSAEDLMDIDKKIFLRNDLLVKCDRMTMANSIEGRVPFLNPQITELAKTIPLREKVSFRQTKIFLRNLMKNRLPKVILTKKKMGLEMPYSHWLTLELKDFMLETLSPDKLHNAGISGHKYVFELINEHLEKRVDHGRKLWALINYVKWYDTFIANNE